MSYKCIEPFIYEINCANKCSLEAAHFGSVLRNMLSLFMSFPPSLHVWGKAKARILLLFVSFPPSLHSLAWSWGTDFVAICVIPAFFCISGARLVQGPCRYLRHSRFFCMSGDKSEDPFLSLFVSFPPPLHIFGRA